MSAPLNLSDLKRILTEVAGVAEGVDLDGDILDTTFSDLGYDSLALLEAGSRIERQYAVSLDDETIGDAQTPRQLIDAVNAHLTPA